MRCFAYSRFSTDRQDETSIADQQRVCTEYAARHGWTVAQEFTDAGISGAALGNRPGARAAIAAAGGGDALLVNDLSRLARSQDLAPLITRLRHRGVRVIGVQDGFDSDSRHAGMQAGLSGIMSEEFRRMVADRTRSALELRARDGRPTGGKAYSDVDVVREIFARFAAGETMKAIASDLNRREIPAPGSTWKTRGGAGTRNRWLVSALHAMLHNERYIGRLVWNRCQMVKDPDTGKRVRRMNPESEWIVREVPAIVDKSTWRKVQTRFARHTGGRGGARRYVLSGLLECGLCGSKLIVAGGRGHRYACGTFHGGGLHACRNSITVARKVAEDRIIGPVLERMLAPDAVTEGLRRARRKRAEEKDHPNAGRAELEALQRMVREGELSPEVASPAIAEARRKAEDLDDLETISEEAWREEIHALRESIMAPDAGRARSALQRYLGTIPCWPAKGGLIAELRARQILLRTGTGGSGGRWVGSGGRI